MDTQHKSQFKNSKIKYVFGIETYSKVWRREYLFDANADYKNCFSIKEITIVSYFRFPVYKIIREHDVINYLLFGFKIKTESVAELFFNRNLKSLDIDFDDAYILSWPSGETYSWLAYASEIQFTKNKSKKPITVVSRESYPDLVNMYLPDIPCIAIKKLGPFDSENPCMEYASHRFYRDCHHMKVTTYIAFNPLFLPDVNGILKHFAISRLPKNDIDFTKPLKPKPFIPTHSKESLAIKTNNINLNLDNFVFLAPEANTFFKPPSEFWSNVSQKFNKLGLDVFLNSINDNHFIKGCKALPEPLSYSESFVLASKAKAIVSLRSGFTETLLPTETPSIVIFTAGVGPYSPPDKEADPRKKPLFQSHYVKEGSVQGVWYFDYATLEDAADAVLGCYDEMIKSHSYVNENKR